MKQVAKRLLTELAKHHEFASKAQASAINRTEAARAKLQSRGGGEIKHIEYVPKPFDPRVAGDLALDELRVADGEAIVEYLVHQRQYKELMERYAPMPEDSLERVHATARRVGLDATKL